MGRSSRYFLPMLVLLLLIAGGLVFAVMRQREEAEHARLQQLLEIEKARQAEQLRIVGVVEAALPQLRQRAADVEQRTSATSARLYTPARQAEVEAWIRSVVGEVSRGQGVTVDSVAARREDQEGERLHVFSVSLTGPGNVLQPMLARFYAGPLLVRVDRVAASRRDAALRNLQMVIDLVYLEAPEPASRAPSRATVLEPFGPGPTDLAVLDVPGNAAEVTVLRKGREELTSKEDVLVEAAKAEYAVARGEALIARVKELEEAQQINRKVVVENLPTLFQRVRATPVGGAALVARAGEVTFTEYVGVE